MKVFISYSSSDQWVAKRIAAAIEDADVSTFAPGSDIAPGDDFETTILNGLRQSSEVLALITPWSLQRPYLWVELGAAWAAKKRIVLVLYGMTMEEFRSQQGVPELLRSNASVLELNDLDRYVTDLRARNAEGRHE